MSSRKDVNGADRPGTARRALLAGGTAGLAAVAGAALARAQPAGAQTTVTPDWLNVNSFYSKTVTTAQEAITAAIAAVPSTGGVVYFPAGTYSVTSTIDVPIGNSGQGPIYLAGDGRDVSILDFSGSGACIHMYNPNSPTVGFDSIGTWGGGVIGLTINGSATTAQSSGLHIGDGEEYVVDVKVQNFEQAGSYGLHLDNAHWWTGRMHAKAQLLNCDTAVAFDATSNEQGSVNFGYSEWDFDIFAYDYSPNAHRPQNGVILLNGASPYNSVLQIKGEWKASSSNTSSGTMLTVTGTNPNGSNPSSSLTDCQLNIWAEMNGSGSGPTPQTIQLGSSGNTIKGCFGKLVFIGIGATNTPWTQSSGFTLGETQFSFAGEVLGDTTLAPASSSGNDSPLQLAGAPLVYSPGAVDGGTLYVGNGDFFQATLSGNTTVSWGTKQHPQAGPQRKTIILSQPQGETYTVTWPHPTTKPSLTNPQVLWADGIPPTMSSSSQSTATDVYYLETYDGTTWYGLANQNVS